jgi:tryptophan-rich sensory protein
MLDTLTLVETPEGIALQLRSAGAMARAAAWLLVPYLAWVCFATALNAGIVVLN